MASVQTLALDHGPVEFVTSPFCEALIPFLEGQPYISRARVAWNWEITSSCPGLQPAVAPAGFYEGGVLAPSECIHLGLRDWPLPNLFQYYGRLAAVVPSPLWLEPVPKGPGHIDAITVAFTDEWVELKAGLLASILPRFPMEQFIILCREDSRLHREFSLPFKNLRWVPCGFQTASCFIASSRLLLTDKSVFRVMAVGMQHPTLVVEPDKGRHHTTFDPPPEAGAREVIVNGFDAREVVQALASLL